jgi:hypothetical protein
MEWAHGFSIFMHIVCVDAWVSDAGTRWGCSLGKGDEVDQSTPLFTFRDIVADLIDLILDPGTPTGTPAVVVSPDGPTSPVTSRATLSPPPASTAGALSAPTPPRRPAPTAEMARQARGGGGSGGGAAGAGPGSGLSPASAAAGSTSGRSRSLFQSMRISSPALDKFMAHPETDSGDALSANAAVPAASAAGAGAGAGPEVPSPISPNLLPKSGDAGDAFLARIRAALARLKMDVSQAPMLAQVYAMPEHARQMAAAAASDRKGRGSRDPADAADAAVAAVEATMLGLDLGGRFDALADLIAAIINKVTGAPPAPETALPTSTPTLSPVSAVPPLLLQQAVPSAAAHAAAQAAAAEALLPHGLILAVDDAQWLDSMSWSLLGFLARRCPRMFLVLALRRFGRGASDSLLRIESMPECTTVTLGGLSPMGVSRLVAQIYGDNVVAVHERLLDKYAPTATKREKCTLNE